MPREVKIIYDMSERTCYCDSKLHKHEIKPWKMDKLFHIFKQRYKCQKCGKTTTTSLNGIVDKHCNYTTRIKDLILNIDFIKYVSYKNKAKLMQKE